MTSLPSIPISMVDGLPNLASDTYPITCMIWNVQGAGSPAFISSHKELVREHKLLVLTLVETHMGGCQAIKIATILGYSGHTRVDAQGFSGRIWVYWKSEHNQYITMDIQRVGDQPWYFTPVYASPDPTKHTDLWRELEKFASTNNKPWLIAGDFNDTRFTWERCSSCSETSRGAARFNNWVEDMQLLEVQFAGAFHTWARGLTLETRHSPLLDRALCTSDWGLRFNNARVKH
ncbi:uncharacterized protein [Spinacia oleracea]|uniref:Endonuclease/exonuclease/phosphatase domain-containing protein n=1 Tax=Spinacia oleracea TaxID=3562 RepID=A0A9R0J5H4_SPIOL|nr:uncharacterized protein LOC110799354 [Spinacia oleracea]